MRGESALEPLSPDGGPTNFVIARDLVRLPNVSI